MAKYGKSALTCDITLPNFDEYLKKIEASGKSIDEACKKAVNACLPIVEEDMKKGAARHRKGKGKYGTDDVYNAISSKEATISGNFISGKVGIDTNEHPEAFHAVYQEYGDGHSAEFPDPFIRPAYDDNKNKIKKIQREVLRKEGVPIE